MVILKDNILIGILGGGQLAMMMVEMSAKLKHIEFIVVDPSDSPPASKVANCIKSEFDNKEVLDKLINECSMVTIDFENVPAETLKYLEKKIPVYPGSYAVSICQDRLKEKNLFNKSNVPTTPYEKVDSLEQLENAVNIIGRDSILKSRTLGYDGKNQQFIGKNKLDEIWNISGRKSSILEKKVNFKTEVSLIGINTHDGEKIFYPLVENFHNNGILNYSIAPYKNETLQKKAESFYINISNSLNYVGVLVIEFFIDSNDNLIANEMAPRVHNSGHWTNEGANINQFEAHISAISGKKVNEIKLSENSAMINILSKMPKNILSYDKSVKVYDYGKKERINRKMGHLSFISKDRKTLLKKVESIKKIIF